MTRHSGVGKAATGRRSQFQGSASRCQSHQRAQNVCNGKIPALESTAVLHKLCLPLAACRIPGPVRQHLYCWFISFFIFFLIQSSFFFFPKVVSESQEEKPAGQQGRHRLKLCHGFISHFIENTESSKVLFCCCTPVTLTEGYFPSSRFWGWVISNGEAQMKASKQESC